MIPSANRLACPTPPAAFSVLTWNVYFAPFQWETRMKYILDEASRLQPDVICFQEVVPGFLNLLQRPSNSRWSYSDSNSDTTWLEHNDYLPSTLDPDALMPYGVLTLAKRVHKPVFETVDLPTRMGRRLLLTHLGCIGEGKVMKEKDGSFYAEYSKGHKGWTVGNVHLESLNSAPLRAEQLTTISQALREAEQRGRRVILGGDFNFDSERNYDADTGPKTLENDVLADRLPFYRDLWPILHKGRAQEREGFTFDGTRNTLIAMPRKDPQMRYDRVLYRGTVIPTEGGKDMPGGCLHAWEAEEIRLVGTETRESLFLSDHFGLLARFRRSLRGG